MNKNKMIKFGILGLIVIILFIIINGIFFNTKKEDIYIVDANQSIKNQDYEISINDFYQANYIMSDDLDYKFDKYLAIDLKIKNITEQEKKFISLDHFLVDDGSKKSRHFIIDENKKSYAKTIEPNQEFDITLTFPVYNSDKYILYFDQTIKKEDEKKLGFELDGTSLKKKDVKQTKDHDLFNDLKKMVSESKKNKGEK